MGLFKSSNFKEFAFGGAGISGEKGGYAFGHVTEDVAINLVKEALDLGIQIFDTAPIYGFGDSEVRIGKGIKGRREEAFVVSKSGVTWHDNGRVDMTNDPKVTLKMLEQSLRDIDSEYIDLYMIHWPDKKVDIRYPLEVLQKAKDDQKIKHIGLCNTHRQDLRLAKEVCQIEVIQSELNVFNTAVKDEILPYCIDNDLSFMSWGTLDKGILTGSISKKREQAKNYDEKDCRKNAPWWNQKEVLRKVEFFENFLPEIQKKELTPLEFAIGHNLFFDDTEITPLVGVKSSKQLHDVVAAFDNIHSKRKEIEQLILKVHAH
ncbi:MAG: aldo/keto reductase [Oligoflexia bacterium]|nr:aldo/keto reductase [Oligoflexia bacterium]